MMKPYSREPKYPLAEVIRITDIPFAVLRNWLDHNLLPMLDAERRPDKGRHRRFSERDIAILQRVRTLTQRPTVEEAARMVSESLDKESAFITVTEQRVRANLPDPSDTNYRQTQSHRLGWLPRKS